MNLLVIQAALPILQAKRKTLSRRNRLNRGLDRPLVVIYLKLEEVGMKTSSLRLKNHNRAHQTKKKRNDKTMKPI